ncbi:hypothetical protein G5714_019386 [Onychostoma macrolepis]|uniref:Uncharacterized protein n=1 Tax=Onychostoma macrolepis TaxID=369639 RepID=A0A7J6BWB8_9TELE|nr:hypothetical protein G5714_019386 [Onychostoma macrolepis]
MFGSSWSGQSALMVQRECSDHELTLPHLSLISPLPYMSLLSCSALTRSTEIQQLVWPADSAGQLWILRFPKRLLNIVCYFVVRIKVSPFSYSASESSITRT